jgi:TetR/AcrR family transcriptional regulator
LSVSDGSAGEAGTELAPLLSLAHAIHVDSIDRSDVKPGIAAPRHHTLDRRRAVRHERGVKKRAVGRRPQAEAEVTRQRIVSTARALFAERGFDAVGLREISQAAGTTHGLMRHHFGTKLGVWQAVADSADREFVGALGPLLEQDPSGDARLAAARFIDAFVELSAQHPDLVRLLMHEGTVRGPRLDYLLRYLSSAHRRLSPMVARLHARGLVTQFSSETLFHFLLFSTAAPFALPCLSSGLIGSKLSVREQADRLIKTLLG